MQFLAAYETKAFRFKDWENQKSNNIFFHVMRRMGIIKKLYKNYFTIDKEKLNALGHGAIFREYQNYLNAKKQNKVIKTLPANSETELLNEVFNEMPNEFSSHDFCKVLAGKGFSRAKIKKGAAAEYLKSVSIQNEKWSRTWRKIPVQPQLSIHDINVPVAMSMTEQGAIAYLKSLGYKIMKPINQWEEI